LNNKLSIFKSDFKSLTLHGGCIMPEFKVVISDPRTGTTKQIELKDERTRALLGKKIGDVIDGELIGQSGVKLQITGGSDYAGFPMRPDIEGAVKKYILIGKGIGFHPKRPGERRRRLVRGNTINEDIVQINMKIVAQKEKEKKRKTRKTKTKKSEETSKQEKTDTASAAE